MAKLEVELLPFDVPHLVYQKVKPGKRGDGFNEKRQQSYAIADLDDATLDQLCREFRINVFAHAGRNPPEQR